MKIFNANIFKIFKTKLPCYPHSKLFLNFGLFHSSRLIPIEQVLMIDAPERYRPTLVENNSNNTSIPNVRNNKPRRSHFFMSKKTDWH